MSEDLGDHGTIFDGGDDRQGDAAVAKLHGATLTLGDNATGVRVVLCFKDAAGAQG